jgi:hypothetical protein
MRSESLVNPNTPGAGRRYSYSYFGPVPSEVGNSPQRDVAMARPTGTPQAGYWSYQSGGALPFPNGTVLYKGRVAWALTSDANSNSQVQPDFSFINRPLMCPFQEDQGTASFAMYDDFSCWSLSAILAFDNPVAPVTGDLGLLTGPNGNSAIRTSPFFQSGMEIGPIDVSTIGVLIRQATNGPATFSAPTPDQPDLTEFNKYEIRFLSGDGARPGMVRFLLNERVQFSLPYGPGTVLPGQKDPGGNVLGFFPNLCNRKAQVGTARMYIAFNGMTVSAAPTEADLI